MSGWAGQLVRVMWEVLQELRCDQASKGEHKVHRVAVATPSLDQEHCRSGDSSVELQRKHLSSTPGGAKC